MPSTAIGSLQPGDYLVLALGLAVIVGAITPLFRKLTATQASGVAFGVLLLAAPVLQNYTFSAFGVSISRDEAADTSKSLADQIDALNASMKTMQAQLVSLAATAAPAQRNQIQAATEASDAQYNRVAATASQVRLRVFGVQNFIHPVTAAPAPASSAAPAAGP